ncbi:hypothetical protein TNCV_4569991 [Trichonephila clavipes]|nr:hypothetical protein TNCV_4569991 [Trichonephila clavipes]
MPDPPVQISVFQPPVQISPVPTTPPVQTPPFLDHFETGLAIEQQETPMDLTMPRLKKKVRKTIGFKVIKPLDLSVSNCLPFM